MRKSDKMPVVIYLHGNAGCKLEGECYAPLLCSLGINLFTFDFNGCGNSSGEWVTLGWDEREDLKAVCAHLKTLGNVGKIGFWGRSMGASCAVMYMADNTDSAACAVLDSGFSTVDEIFNYIANDKMGIPPEFSQMLIMGIKG